MSVEKYKNHRIFIGFTEIAGYYSALSEGFKEIGVAHDYYNLSFGNPISRTRGEKNEPLFVKLYRTLGEKFHIDNSPIRKFIFSVSAKIMRFLLLIYACFRYDTFIFGFGTSFFNQKEFPLLKILGKKIICTMGHGSESRPPFIDGTHEVTIDKIYKKTLKQKRMINWVCRYADVVVSHAGVAHFFTRPFVMVQAVGRAVTSAKPTSTITNKDSDVIRVLHAPTNFQGKGSSVILGIIKKMQKKYNIELILLQNVPNTKIIDAIESCDIVFDQLYADHFLGGFALEACRLGKAVVQGNLGYPEFIEDIGWKPFPPKFHCRPEDAEEIFEQALSDVKTRKSIGEEAREFMKNWTPQNMAKNFIKMVEGDIPNEWLYDPKDIRYVYGVCLTKKHCRERIRLLVEKYGKKALQVGDKPQLEDAFLKFAYEE